MKKRRNTHKRRTRKDRHWFEQEIETIDSMRIEDQSKRRHRRPRDYYVPVTDFPADFIEKLNQCVADGSLLALEEIGDGIASLIWVDVDREPPPLPPGYEWCFVRNKVTGKVRIELCRNLPTP